MTAESSWWRRLEERRTTEKLSVDRLVGRLGVSRATYYNWRADPERYPRNATTVELVAQYLNEDATSLGNEMGRADLPSYASFVEAAAARELSVRLYQGHVQAMAHAIGMSDGMGRQEGVDVVCRLLREGLSGPPDPSSVVVGVTPVRRGSRRREPYQYQIYVLPGELATCTGPEPPDSAPAVLETLRAKVDKVLDGALLPVTREHSTGLALPLLRGRVDLLLHPVLLDLRPPEWNVSSAEVPDLLVVGVYYSGAPDVGALLARAFGHGFSTFEHLARLVQAAGLRGLPDDRLVGAAERVAQSVLAGESPAAGGTVWSTDDPRAVLGPRTGALLRGNGFPGRVILLELTGPTLDYAAHRVACVHDRAPDAGVEAWWRATLAEQQAALRELVTGPVDWKSGPPIVLSVDLPAGVVRRADGGYDDEVDRMFDVYDEAAGAIADRLVSGR